MRILFLIFLFSAILDAQEQFTLSGYVSDLETKKPVEFVTVTNINFHKGYYTDKDGYFAVLARPNDTILFSSIAYDTDTLIVTNNDVVKIALNPATIELSTVYIGEVDSISTVGFPKDNNKYGFAMGMAGYEYSTLIKSDLHSGKRVMSVKVAKKSKKGKGRIRLHLYSVGIDSLPDKDLLVTSLIINSEDFKKELIFDVKDYGITLPPEGIYVALEWLDSYPVGGEEKAFAISLSKLPIENKIYIRNRFYNMGWKSGYKFSRNMCATLEIQE